MHNLCKHYIRIFVFSLCTLGVLCFPNPLQAVDALSLQVYPPTTYLSVKPGAGMNHQVKLKNDGLYTLEVTPLLVNFHSDEVHGQVILEQTSDFPHLNLDGDPNKWGKPILVKPGEEQLLNFVITLPSDAAYAEHHLSILFQAQQLSYTSLSQENSIIAAVVASNVVVLVSPDEINRGELVVEELRLPRFADSFVGFAFSGLVRNVGSNAAPITGHFKISHWPDTTPVSYELYPDMVLAEGKRMVRAMHTDRLQELEQLEARKDVLLAAGEDFESMKHAFVNEHLRSQFLFKQPVMVGAYDIELQVGGSVLQKRVIVLPFSVLIIALLLPPLYWLAQVLRATLKKH